VAEGLAAEKEGAVGYTTVLKLMQIMAEKGLVTRDESDRTHVYTARGSQGETQRALVSDLVDRAFGGSAAALVLQALQSGDTSPQELAEIERLIDDYRRTRTGKRGKSHG